MLTQCLYTPVFWLSAILIYKLFLRRETHWQLNRFYLLGALMLGTVLPWIEIQQAIPGDVFLPEITIDGIEKLTQWTRTGGGAAGSRTQPWLLIYLSGLLFFLLRTLFGLYQIYRLIQHSEKQAWQGFTLVIGKAVQQPFSFLHWIFLPANIAHSSLQRTWILRHEEEHLRQKHSYDLLFIELLNIAFWPFSPLLMWYKQLLSELHEYQADEAVLRIADKKEYGLMLLQNCKAAKAIPLTQAFFSNLQKRFVMMSKPKSRKSALLKYAIALPFLIGLFFFANISISYAQQQSQKIFKIVDEMPRFPGCEDAQDKKERENCAFDKMLKFIYTNIKYPESARKAGIQGTVVVSFVVEKDGSISNLKVVRSISPDCDEEVLRVIKMMPNWIPGKQDGEPVRVQFNLPVRFALEAPLKDKG